MSAHRLHCFPANLAPTGSEPLPTSSSPRIPHYLLCASAAHCAQLLRSTAQARVSLHGLTPTTQWPEHLPFGASVLWVMAPETAPDTVIALQTAWREHLQAHRPGVSIRMLYGSAEQQARQMQQWQQGLSPASIGSAGQALHPADCRECLDPASERQLFSHLQNWALAA